MILMIGKTGKLTREVRRENRMGHTSLGDQALRYVWKMDMEQRDCRSPGDHPHQNPQTELADYMNP